MGVVMLGFAAEEIQNATLEKVLLFSETINESLQLLSEYQFPNSEQIVDFAATSFSKQLADIRIRYIDIILHNSKESPHKALSLFLNSNLQLDKDLATKLFMKQYEVQRYNQQKQLVVQLITLLKELNKKFQDTVLLTYKQCIDQDIPLPIELITLIEWIGFGLENISNFSFEMYNNGLSWVNKQDVSNDNSFKGALKFGFSKYVIQYFQVSERVSNIIFDFEMYLKTLDGIKANFKHAFDRDNQNLQHIVPKRNMAVGANPKPEMGLESFSKIQELISLLKPPTRSQENYSEASKYLEQYKVLMQQKLLFEIKKTIEILENMNELPPKGLAMISQIKKLFDIAASWEKNPHDFSLNIDDVINECRFVLQAGVNDILCSQYYLVQLLVVSLIKLIDIYKLKSIEVQKINEVMSPFFKEMLIEYSRKRCWIELNLNASVGIVKNPHPEFNGFEPVKDKIVKSGAQEKLKGSGFYRNGQDQYYVKGTTNLSLIADDLCEVLASRMAQLLGIQSFADCAFLKSINTNDVYIRSKVTKGFRPIYDMEKRPFQVSTRLLPSESEDLLNNLSRQQKRQLKQVLYTCLILGDYDPNPNNLGFTVAGITKIDHGWAFDGICKRTMPLWKDTLNYFRYAGRIAPTNSVCDYAELFDEVDCLFFKNVRTHLNEQSLKQCVKQFIEDAMLVYVGTTAHGYLKSAIEPTDILEKLCERLGVAIDANRSIDELADLVAERITARIYNLALCCILEHLKKHDSSRIIETELRFCLEYLKAKRAFLIDEKAIDDSFQQILSRKALSRARLQSLYSLFKQSNINDPKENPLVFSSLAPMQATPKNKTSVTHEQATKKRHFAQNNPSKRHKI